jgi:hypothetical protein
MTQADRMAAKVITHARKHAARSNRKRGTRPLALADVRLIRAAVFEACGEKQRPRRFKCRGGRCCAWVWERGIVRKCRRTADISGYCRQHRPSGG